MHYGRPPFQLCLSLPSFSTRWLFHFSISFAPASQSEINSNTAVTNPLFSTTLAKSCPENSIPRLEWRFNEQAENSTQSCENQPPLNERNTSMFFPFIRRGHRLWGNWTSDQGTAWNFPATFQRETQKFEISRKTIAFYFGCSRKELEKKYSRQGCKGRQRKCSF